MEVNSHSDKIIIGNIFRPPQEHFNGFIKTNTSSLHEVSRSFTDHKFIVMGDFNLDLFKISSDSCVLNYYLQLVPYSSFPAILRAARVTKTNYSFFDNISTSNSETTLRSGIILCNISDHYPTFCSFSWNGSAYHRPQVLTYKKKQFATKRVQIL